MIFSMQDGARGIVLKVDNDQSGTIILLDKIHGRITAGRFTRAYRKTGALCNGSLLAYTLVERGSSYTITDVQAIAVPFELAKNDLAFFHHILEMARYFTCPSQPVPELYELMLVILFEHYVPMRAYHKTLFLVKFFVMIGMYPDGAFARNSSFMGLISQPLDVMLKTMNSQMVDALEEWVQTCIDGHPYRKKFKTISCKVP